MAKGMLYGTVRTGIECLLESRGSLVGKQHGTTVVQAGTYDQLAQHRRRYIIRRALISPGSLLSRWTSGVPIEQCLARDVPCPQEIVAGLPRTATRFRPLKFLHAILKVRATQKRMNFSTKERETFTLYLGRGREDNSTFSKVKPKVNSRSRTLEK